MPEKNLLTEGDIIELKPGHRVYTKLPAHFVYANREGYFTSMSTATVTIGHRTGPPGQSMDTGWLAGRYIVTTTSTEGGGTGHGPHDVYPSGHRVFCRRETKDHAVIEVNFYQTGCFTAMIENILPIGKAEAVWVERAPTKGENHA